MVRTENKAIRWREFEIWLLNQYKPTVARERRNYAKKYADLLLQADLSPLQSLNVDKRLHVLKALSALSKFLGNHEDFRLLVKNHGFKWSVSSDDLIIRRLTKSRDTQRVFNWIKEVKETSPELSPFMDFITMSGLRLVEALESYNLIIRLADSGRLAQYYDQERETLEHFKFKEIFLRKTKKAFISFVPRTMITRIAESKPLTHSYVISIRKKGLKRMFGDIREAYATLLTKHLSPAEIDFLQGRVSGTVFMRNYFNPALIRDLKERVFKGLADFETNL